MRQLTDAEVTEIVDCYERDGYAFARGLFDASDLAPLVDALGASGASPGGFSVTDSQGGQQELSVWMNLADDFIGVLPRIAPMAAIAQAVLQERAAHWHSKLSWKRPGTTSLWDWHQDYGFWANEGVPRSDMCTIAIALGPITEANGCMRLVRGSHRLGRIEVVPFGESQAADPVVVDAALQDHDTVLCELAIGDVVVFHSNTLHSSGPNESDLPRTMLMASYTGVSNQPTNPEPGRQCLPLDVVPALMLQAVDTVFGPSAFINPLTDGNGQGYSVTVNETT